MPHLVDKRSVATTILLRQVALKWGAIDSEFIHIELSRVYNREKTDIKTEDSRRSIQIRPGIQKWIDKQKN